MAVRTQRLEIRLTEKEKNRIKILAGIYCEGNISQWVVHAAINAPRKILNKKGPAKK